VLISDRPLVVTVESHYINGGLGSLVAETIADRGLGTRVIRRGAAFMPGEMSGSQRYLERSFGLAADQLADVVVQALAAR